MALDIEKNKQRYLGLLSSISSERVFNESAITDYLLNKSDFFTAPASVKNYLSEKGGLCQHCLDVYDTLKKLVALYPNCGISEDSIIIVSLFHDIAEANYYKSTKKNVNTGSGWVVEEGYTVIPAKERYTFGSHEETCEHITRTFFPDLTDDEALAILYHHAGTRDDSAQTYIGNIWTDRLLPLLLHFADTLTMFAPISSEEPVDSFTSVSSDIPFSPIEDSVPTEATALSLDEELRQFDETPF